MRYLAALVAMLFLCSCAPKKSSAVFIDPSLETLIPADTIFVIGAKIDSIKDTQVYKKLLQDADLPQLQAFIQETGIDPRKDLWQVLSVSNGKSAMLMARGQFSTGDLEPKLQGDGAERFGYKGYSLFGNERGAVVFFNQSTALMGPTAQLKQVIDARDQPAHGLPTGLRDQIKALRPTDQIWAAVVGGFDAFNIGVPEGSNLGNAIGMLKGIDAMRLGIDLRNGFAAQAVASCGTESDAKHIRDALKGIIGLGRLNTPDNQPELLKLYDSIHVNLEKNVTDVQVDISPELTDRFLDLWLKRR